MYMYTVFQFLNSVIPEISGGLCLPKRNTQWHTQDWRECVCVCMCERGSNHGQEKLMKLSLLTVMLYASLNFNTMSSYTHE